MNTATAKETESVTLYYREGSSDKVYQASIEPKGERFVVNFAYGRRGTTLSTGTKTSSPVDYATAKQTLDKLVREKIAKGYTPGPDGTPYQHADKEERTSGILPQLLNPVDENTARRLLDHPDWCAQEKHDGRRMLILKTGAEIHGINRKGLLVGLPESLFQAVRLIPGDFVLDGECIGEVLYAFDVLSCPVQEIAKRPYQERLLTLINLLALSQQRGVRIVQSAFTSGQKRDLFHQLQREKREGIVFKRLDAPYTAGRPNSGGSQLKHKFYASLSAVVAKVNAQRSVELRLLNCKGWIPVGNVTIPANQPVPKVGDIVEVRYLYAFPESKTLYQPVYLGLRKDIGQHECVLSQLKYKAGEEEEC